MTTTGALRDKLQNLAARYEDMSEMAEVMKTLVDIVEELDTTELDKDVFRHDKRLDNLDEAVQEVDCDDLRTRLDTIESRLDERCHNGKTLIERLDDLEEKDGVNIDNWNCLRTFLGYVSLFEKDEAHIAEMKPVLEPALETLSAHLGALSLDVDAVKKRAEESFIPTNQMLLQFAMMEKNIGAVVSVVNAMMDDDPHNGGACTTFDLTPKRGVHVDRTELALELMTQMVPKIDKVFDALLTLTSLVESQQKKA